MTKALTDKYSKSPSNFGVTFQKIESKTEQLNWILSSLHLIRLEIMKVPKKITLIEFREMFIESLVTPICES